jgi:hypothetical protein
MSNETDNSILGTIHYIDFGNYYMVYGIVTLIIVLLLLWFFVRSNMEQITNRCKICYKKISSNTECCESCLNKIKYYSNRCSTCNAKKQFCNCSDEASASRKPTQTSRKHNILSDLEHRLKMEDETYIEHREGMYNIENTELLYNLPEFKTPDVAPVDITNIDNSYNMRRGSYGGVEVNIYDIADSVYGPEWDTYKAIYTPNTRTSFRNTITPKESVFWEDDAIDGIYGEFNGDVTCMNCTKKRSECICSYRTEQGRRCSSCRESPRNCKCSIGDLIANISICKNCTRKPEDCGCKYRKIDKQNRCVLCMQQPWHCKCTKEHLKNNKPRCLCNGDHHDH